MVYGSSFFGNPRHIGGEPANRKELTGAGVDVMMSLMPLEAAGGKAVNYVAKAGGLTDDVAKTFLFKRYTKITLDQPMVLSRYYDNVNAFARGRFMTRSISKFTILDRIGLALRPSWNNMTKVAHWEIPTGTTIYKGRAGIQFPWLGGKTQYFVPELGGAKRVIQ